MKGSKWEWHGFRLGGVLDLCGWVERDSREEKERRETAVTLEDSMAFTGGTTITQLISRPFNDSRRSGNHLKAGIARGL